MKVFSLGLPTSMNTIINSVSGVVANRFLSTYGELAIAAMSVTGKTTMVISMLQMGIAMGIQPVLAYHYGAKNYRNLKNYTLRCGIVTMTVGSLLTLFCVAFGPSIVRIFLKEPAVIEMGTVFVRYSLIAGPVTGLVQLCTSFLQSTEKPFWALVMSTTRDGLMYLPLLIILNSNFGLMGYVFARPITTFVTALVAVFLIAVRYKKILAMCSENKISRLDK